MNELRGEGHRPVPAENQNEITREFSPEEQAALRSIDEIRQRSGPEIAQRALEAVMLDLNQQEAARRMDEARALVAKARATPKERRPAPINFEPPAELRRSSEGVDLSEQSIRTGTQARYRK